MNAEIAVVIDSPLQDAIAAAVFHVLPDHAVAEDDSSSVVVWSCRHPNTKEQGILLSFMETGHLFAFFTDGGEYRHAGDSPDDEPRATIAYENTQYMVTAILEIAQHYTDHGEPPIFECSECGGAA